MHLEDSPARGVFEFCAVMWHGRRGKVSAGDAALAVRRARRRARITRQSSQRRSETSAELERQVCAAPGEELKTPAIGVLSLSCKTLRPGVDDWAHHIDKNLGLWPVQ